MLLSDVDVAILDDSFQFLYRDADWEGMTDGFDDPTAYDLLLHGGVPGHPQQKPCRPPLPRGRVQGRPERRGQQPT